MLTNSLRAKLIVGTVVVQVAILAAMKTLGLNAKIIKAASPTIKATLQTPKGKIELV